MSPAGPESEPDTGANPARATAHRRRSRVYPKKRRLPAMRCWRNRSARPYRASSRARLGRSICGELRPSFDVASQQRHSYASCADTALRTSRPRHLIEELRSYSVKLTIPNEAMARERRTSTLRAAHHSTMTEKRSRGTDWTRRTLLRAQKRERQERPWRNN